MALTRRHPYNDGHYTTALHGKHQQVQMSGKKQVERGRGVSACKREKPSTQPQSQESTGTQPAVWWLS